MACELEFQLQPTLVGQLIEIRPLGPNDFELLFRAANDPLLWEQHPEPTRYKRDVFQMFFKGAIESGGAFVVIERTSGTVIGSSRFCNLNPAESEVEIGWTFLQRSFWGGSYNGELKALMINHALRFVERVVFVVGENNVRSRRALEKIGARLIGTSDRPAQDGSQNLVFGITRDIWRPR